MRIWRFGWGRPRTLRQRLTASYGLKKVRRWFGHRRCGYTDPDWWLAAEVRGVLVTFWGAWTGDEFKGEMVLGPADVWTRYGARREPDLTLNTVAEPGNRCEELEPVRRLRSRFASHLGCEHFRLVLDGAYFQWQAGTEGPIREMLETGIDAVLAIRGLPNPPLLEAVERGDHDAAGQLLRAGADPEEYATELMRFGGATPDKVLHRPLMAAVRRNDAEMVELLLRQGAQWQTNPGLPLLVALRERANAALASLLKAGFPPEAMFWERETDTTMPAIQLAAKLGNVPAVRLLLEAETARSPFGRAALLAAARAASGPATRELRQLLRSTALLRPDLSARPPISARRAARVIGSHALATGAVLALALGADQSPRAAVYGFFVHYLFRLGTLAAMLRLHARGPAWLHPWLARCSRRPEPGQLWLPVTVNTGRGALPGALAAYLGLMTLFLALMVLLVNTRNNQLVGSWAEIGHDMASAALFALVWWVQDLFDRRNVLRFDLNLPANLGFNSDETGVGALTVLFGGTISAVSGSPWGAFVALLVFKTVAEASAQLRRPPES